MIAISVPITRVKEYYFTHFSWRPSTHKIALMRKIARMTCNRAQEFSDSLCCNRTHVHIDLNQFNETFGEHQMTEQEKRKGGGGKLARSETVTVRLDPKLRYLAELAARKQRRTLSSYIEWSIEDSLGRTYIDANVNHSLADSASQLWDVDDADRFAKLALRHPDLLTHEEQVRWKLIRENGYLWKGGYLGTTKKWTWSAKEESLLFERLREHWHAFCAVADGSAEPDTLPTWKKLEAKIGFEDMDDDIPF